MIDTESHPGIESLSAYADGELDPAAVARVERHLSACVDCREQLRRVRDLVSAAGVLPRDITPPPEVWSSLQGRVARNRVPSRWKALSGGWLAAAAVLLVAGAMLLRPGRSEKMQLDRAPVVVPVVLSSVDRNYAGTIADLRGTLEAQRSTLSPATIRVLEHSVAVIDTAIAEARAALASDPANTALVEILSAQYELKVDLLQRATKLSSSL